MGTCESTTGPSNLCSRPRCVTKKFKLLSLTMGPECARPGSPEMTPPDVSSLPSWAVPSTRDTCPAWDRRRSTLETRPRPRGDPPAQVPHRARDRHQLGRHGEDLAPHFLQRAPCIS